MREIRGSKFNKNFFRDKENNLPYQTLWLAWWPIWLHQSPIAFLPNFSQLTITIFLPPPVYHKKRNIYLHSTYVLGSCVIIHGNVIHRSLPNRSQSSRNAYTFHIYDSAVSQYSSENWLQTDFLTLYDN